MNYTWDLDVLYKSTDSKEFLDDLSLLDSYIEEVNTFSTQLTRDNEAETIHKFLELQIKLVEVEFKLADYLSYNMSTDTTNSTYASLMGQIQSKGAKVAKAFSIFDHYVAETENLDAIIESDPLLKEHSYLLKKTKEDASHMLSDDVEEVISKLNVNSVSAWGNLQDFLTSTVEVDIVGKRLIYLLLET